jgi:hypothetical protein
MDENCHQFVQQPPESLFHCILSDVLALPIQYGYLKQWELKEKDKQARSILEWNLSRTLKVAKLDEAQKAEEMWKKIYTCQN